MKYLYNVLSLWVCGYVSFVAVKHAIKNKPIAICGKRKYYVVDDRI